MPFIYVDFDVLRKNIAIPIELDRRVIKFLEKTENPFIRSNQTQIVPKSGLSSFISSEETQVAFSHNIVKSASNKWHIIENNTKGEGSFGVVNESQLIMSLFSDKGVQLETVMHIVKVQSASETLPYDILTPLAKKEAIMQKQHGVDIIAYIETGTEVITIADNCGLSLDKLLPLKPSNHYSFEYRLAIAARIASEMLLLQQKGVVHRDLKPANICFKSLSNGQFSIIFIDFGLAEEVNSSGNKGIAGTYAYMAPEVFQQATGSTYASDMYALAPILGSLFGAKNVLKNKKLAKSANALVNAPFCFDGLFEGFNVAHIDPYLLNDLKNLLELLGNKNPDSRPSIHVLNKFLITVPSRMQQIKHFKSEWKRVEALFKQFEGYQEQLHLLTTKHQLIEYHVNNFDHTMTTENAFSAQLITSQQTIYEALSNLPLVKSHLDLANTLVLENRMADFDGNDNPYPNLQFVTELLINENQKLESALDRFAQCLHEFTSGIKFVNTNSSGIQMISQIMLSETTPIEKLQQLQKLGSQKIEKGFWNYYSHSSFFGKGRHQNVDELYHKLAKIDPDNLQNKEEYLAKNQLDDLIQFIESNHFVH